MIKFIISVLILIPMACFAGSPSSFFGTYQSSSMRDCEISFLVIDKDKVSIDECKKLSYRIIDTDEHYTIIDVMPSRACARKLIKIERKEQQYEAEGKGPRSDVPTFINFIVTIYENYDNNAKTNKPVETRSYRQVNPSKAKDQTIIFLTGKTGPERKEALHEINLQCYSEREKYNEIGLRDQSPDVRDVAVWFLRGEPDHFVPMLINTMALDPDAKVRASAGTSLSHFYTDNGSDGDIYIKPLEKNLDKLLLGLKNVETLRSIVEILGSRYAGDSVAPCYMSVKSQKKTLDALKNQLNTIQLAAEAWRKDSSAPWHNEWNEAEYEIINAIENINKCHLTLTRPPRVNR
jgi:hypothetical protein